VRVERLVASATVVARQELAEPLHLPLRLVDIRIDVGDVHDPFAQCQRLLDRLGDPRSRVRADDVAIDDDLDAMLAPVVDLRWLVQAVRLAVHPHPHISRPANLVEKRFVLFLPLALERGHQVDLGAFREREDPLNDLVGGLGANRDLADRTIGLAQPGVEDAKVVVDLGDRADGRSRAFGCGLLLDADGR